MWRGGRPFKSPQEISNEAKNANGTKDAVISLDSDDEDTTTGEPFEDKPDFEEEEEDLDISNPFLGVLQDLDLYFGTDVLHLALLPVAALKADGHSDLEPFKQDLFFAAACADNNVRLVSLPLTPPSPASKERADFKSNFTLANAGNGKWGERVSILVGHQKPSDAVSMTVDLPLNAKRQRTKTDSQPSTADGSYIIVASHSREMTGLLLLYRVPITSSNAHLEPFQTIHLISPAKSIAFNPSLARRHSSQISLADATGAVRVYDYKLPLKSAVPDELDGESLAAEQGSWLLSLYAGFQGGSDDESIGNYAGFGRKTIIDAQWVSGGKAIIALFDDGEWGHLGYRRSWTGLISRSTW